MPKKRYSIKGMMCAACVSHVERAVRSTIEDRSYPFTVSLLTNSLSVTYPDSLGEQEIGKIEKSLAKSIILL